ncbi:MAG: ABC transporter substrate-binding protein [Eubacteriales bacterium]
MKVKKLSMLFMLVGATLAISGCGSKEVEVVDYNSMSLDEIIEGAQEEGQVNSVAMPDTWANWEDTWNELEEIYGVVQTDLDMSSSEEIALFKEEGTDGTKDIGDVGQQWGPVAEEEGVTLQYKTSYWDEIPDWAKDEDGDWMVCYVGTIAIITNDALVENAPTSFADILAGDYKVTVGDVSSASQAQHTILATAYAMGGDMDNLEPAYEFWTTLAEQGRIDTGEANTARLESGEIAVGLYWDYNALNYRDNAVANNPDASFTVCIPSDGSVQSGYASIININAPNPYAACLAREYILSDEGQINLAIGYATPIRDVEIPAEVEATRISSDQYEGAIAIEDFDKWTETCQELITYWEENIIPMIG